jgi:hypothetical protein
MTLSDASPPSIAALQNSFDHLVGAGEQCRRHVEAKREWTHF